MGEDVPEQKLIADIGQYGWHCMNVLAEGDEGPFSFTIGLFQTYGYPELIIFGLRSELAHRILAIAAGAIQAGRPIDLSRPSDELVEGPPCCFVEVPKSQYEQHLGFARWYYRGDEFPTWQIVYPSRFDGRFPWHPEASESFKALQPVLGHPHPAA